MKLPFNFPRSLELPFNFMLPTGSDAMETLALSGLLLYASTSVTGEFFSHTELLTIKRASDTNKGGGNYRELKGIAAVLQSLPSYVHMGADGNSYTSAIMKQPQVAASLSSCTRKSRSSTHRGSFGIRLFL